MDEIPANLSDKVAESRAALIEALAEVDDEIGELFLEDLEPSEDQLKQAIRERCETKVVFEWIEKHCTMEYV